MKEQTLQGPAWARVLVSPLLPLLAHPPPCLEAGGPPLLLPPGEPALCLP